MNGGTFITTRVPQPLNEAGGTLALGRTRLPVTQMPHSRKVPSFLEKVADSEIVDRLTREQFYPCSSTNKLR